MPMQVNFHPMNKIYLFLLFLLLTSCEENKGERILRWIQSWECLEIIFPKIALFTIQGKDTVDFDWVNVDFKIVTYVDSTGCTGCKLQLLEWSDFIQEVDSLSNKNVSFVFYFHPKDKTKLRHLLRLNDFTHPVCFDEKDEFNALNDFPKERELQTVLLNKNNEVIVIGNPHYTRSIRNVYLRRITESSNQEKKASLP